jgi:hypothetical protein
MPIKVACQCGAAFAAKDELAGRTVACPKCKQPLKIPAPQAIAASTQAAAVAPQAAPVSHANADLFDDLGLRARASADARCPSCGSDLPPNAVLCVKCGYNLKLGKKMQTVNMAADGSAPVATGHGGQVTAMIMARAAQNAVEDVEAEKKKTTEGMPIWVLVVCVLACVLFGVVMTLIPQGIALIGTSLILLIAAVVIQLYAWVSVMIVAGKKNLLYPLAIFFGDIAVAVGLFFLGMFLDWLAEGPYVSGWVRLGAGAVWLTYAYLNADECGSFIMMFWLSKGLQIVSAVLAFIGVIILVMSKDGQSTGALPPPPPAIHATAQVQLPWPPCC